MRARMKELEDSADPIVQRNQEDYVLPRPLKVGDNVLIADIDKKAVVTKTVDSQGLVEVQAGILKTRVKLENLRLLDQGSVTFNSKPAYNKKRSTSTSVQQTAQTEVDVRGTTVDEAVIEVDKVIDMAIMRGLNEIRVIHGKGTGALRAGLHQHFRRHPSIKSFRLGVYGEGENGVTIIEVK